MKILILNGPNLNIIGQRDTTLYGTATMEDVFSELKEHYRSLHTIDYAQSNIEGALIDKLQNADGVYDGIVFNAGGYTHTSVAIGDTIAALTTPVIEVHMSNIYARETFRQHSYLSSVCAGTITGLGKIVYRLGIEALVLRAVNSSGKRK
ncbi:MAG: type II 3-dehydroquinate dehydratase [Bacteroidales bacterium]|nr:type II 3-dehydroquinate dehydratase [Bacteroidales bacterium]